MSTAVMSSRSRLTIGRSYWIVATRGRSKHGGFYIKEIRLVDFPNPWALQVPLQLPLFDPACGFIPSANGRWAEEPPVATWDLSLRDSFFYPQGPNSPNDTLETNWRTAVNNKWYANQSNAPGGYDLWGTFVGPSFPPHDGNYYADTDNHTHAEWLLQGDALGLPLLTIAAGLPNELNQMTNEDFAVTIRFQSIVQQQTEFVCTNLGVVAQRWKRAVVVLNRLWTWDVDPSMGPSTHGVLLHEFGHVLGLNDTPEVCNEYSDTLMYGVHTAPSTWDWTSKALSAHDVTRLHLLYPNEEPVIVMGIGNCP